MEPCYPILFLAQTREQMGLTQKEIAARMGCTQSKIAKLEQMEDGGIRLSDLRRYAQALGLEMNVGFDRPRKKRRKE